MQTNPSYLGGPAALKQAAELLASAKNPVIVSGGGVVMADGVDAVKALAEALKVLDFTPKNNNLII